MCGSSSRILNNRNRLLNCKDCTRRKRLKNSSGTVYSCILLTNKRIIIIFPAFWFLWTVVLTTLTLFLFVLTIANEDLSSSKSKTRSNSVPIYVGTNAAAKHPMPVTSPPSSTRSSAVTDEPGDESLSKQERLNKLFERLERGDVERLQDISKAVKSFDR